MRIPEEIEKAFYAGVRHPQASLCLNDSVEVISGTYKGRGGAVISIVQLEPSPVFLVMTFHAAGKVS